MKQKLVCIGETFLNGQSGHHLPLFSKYFNVSNYDHTLTYDSDTTFIYRHDEARQQVKKMAFGRQISFVIVTSEKIL